MDARCDECGEPLETPLVCRACGTLHQLGDASSSPFALLGLQETFAVDTKDVRKRLLRFSRHLHPDFFATAPAGVQALAERNTAELNDAHEILADDFRRAAWIVNARGGPDEKQLRDMPQAFLMEVMEWNEALEEARESEPGAPERESLAALGVELTEQRAELLERIAGLLGDVPTEPERLADTRRALSAIRYVDRTLTEMERLRLEQASTRPN